MSYFLKSLGLKMVNLICLYLEVYNLNILDFYVISLFFNSIYEFCQHNSKQLNWLLGKFKKKKKS